MVKYTLDPDHPLVEKMHEWCKANPGPTNYCMVFENEGKLKLYKYKNRPCNGEMRPYSDTHPEEVDDGIERPSDLSIDFPDGHPVAIGLCRNSVVSGEIDAMYVDFVMFSPESPYRNVFPEGTVQLRKDVLGVVESTVLLNTDVDATVLLHAIIFRRNIRHSKFHVLSQKYGCLVAFIHCLTATTCWSSSKQTPYFGYVTSPYVNVERMVKANPLELSGNANSFHDRGVYNRPHLAMIWNDDVTSTTGEVFNFISSGTRTEEDVANFISDLITKV